MWLAVFIISENICPPGMSVEEYYKAIFPTYPCRRDEHEDVEVIDETRSLEENDIQTLETNPANHEGASPTDDNPKTKSAEKTIEEHGCTNDSVTIQRKSRVDLDIEVSRLKGDNSRLTHRLLAAQRR